MTTNQKGTIMGNTMKQERDLVRRWEDVADELRGRSERPGR